MHCRKTLLRLGHKWIWPVTFRNHKKKENLFITHWDYNKAQLMNLKYSDRHYWFVLLLYIIFLGCLLSILAYLSCSINPTEVFVIFCQNLLCLEYIFSMGYLFQIAKTLFSNNLERCVGRYYANLLQILLICFDHLPLIICKFRPCYS